MKRFGLILALLLAAASLAGAAPEVLIVAGRTMMPVRYATESYGAQVIYTQRTRQIALSFDGSSVRLVIGEQRCWYGSEAVMLDTAPFVYGNIVYVPVIVVGRVLKADVRWEAKTRRVSIIRPGKTLVMVGKPFTPPGLAKKGGVPPGQAKKQPGTTGRVVKKAPVQKAHGQNKSEAKDDTGQQHGNGNAAKGHGKGKK